MIVDVLFSVYCFFGSLKGRRRKLPDTLYRLVRNITAMVSGVGFFRWVRNLLSLFLSNFLADTLGFIFGFLLAFIIVRKFKRHLTNWIEHKLEQAEQSKWGAIIGFWTNFFLGSSLMVTACISGEGPIYNFISKDSFLAKACITLIGVFQLFRGNKN